MSEMFVDTRQELQNERRMRRLSELQKTKRQRQVEKFKTQRKQRTFYQLSNRLKHLKPSDRQKLLGSNNADFAFSINQLLESPDMIFPDVPQESPFMASPTGMNKDELAIFNRIRKLNSPGAPKISPIRFDVSPAPIFITEKELEERRLKLLNPVIAGRSVTFDGF